MPNENSSLLSITYLPVSGLKPHPKNPRTHSRKQVKQIAKSIETFGFTNPALIDRGGVIIAGHGRVEAAKLLGLHQVPTVCLEELNQDQIRAYILADNKLAELGGWDEEILATELQHLIDLEEVLDISVTGFEVAEIDLIIEGNKQEPEPTDDFAVDEAGPAVTAPGDLWRLGKTGFCAGMLSSVTPI
jgi:ParB-like chromosome segregation protein Spo0J